MFKLQTLILGLTLAAALPASAKHLELIHYGWIETENQDGATALSREFRIGFGNTEKQDELASTPFRASMGPFGMNAAIYLRNADGTWNLFNYRLPNDDASEEEKQKFISFMRRKDVGELFARPYEPTEFGGPEDFIYKKLSVPSSALPEPFNRFPSAVLARIAMVMQYNANQTAKAYFQQPYDREEHAVGLFQQIVDATEGSGPLAGL